MQREKNGEYEESQIATIYIFDFRLYLAQKHNLKKSCLYHEILLQFLCVAGYLNHSNDTPNLNIHKYPNYLITMSEKNPYFRKRKKHFARTLFTNLIEVTGSIYFGNIFRIMFLPKI